MKSQGAGENYPNFLKTENQKVDESDADAILQRKILEAVKMTIEYLEIERSAKRHIDEAY